MIAKEVVCDDDSGIALLLLHLHELDQEQINILPGWGHDPLLLVLGQGLTCLPPLRKVTVDEQPHRGHWLVRGKELEGSSKLLTVWEPREMGTESTFCDVAAVQDQLARAGKSRDRGRI